MIKNNRFSFTVYSFYLVIFIFLTTNNLSVEELVIEANQTDITSYKQIYEASPKLPEKQDDLQKHVSQRFLVHYSVGFLAKFFNLEPTLIFKIFSIVFYMLIAQVIFKIATFLKISNREKIIFLSIFFLNPYLIRYYQFNFVQLQDLIFLYFGFLFCLFVLKKNENWLSIVSLSSIYLKQSGLAFVIASIFYFFLYKKKFFLKSTLLIFFLFLIILNIKILSDSMTNEPFPIGNVLNIFSYNFLDFDELMLFMEFLAYPILSFFPLIIFVFGKKKILKDDLKKLIVILLAAVMLIGQPIMGGPGIATNLIRLTSLSYPLLLCSLFYTYEINQFFKKNIFFYSFILFLHVWSLHPTFSIFKFFKI